jgi:hypothetical protein
MTCTPHREKERLRRLERKKQQNESEVKETHSEEMILAQ